MFWIVNTCSEEAMIKIWLQYFELFMSGTGVLDYVLDCLGKLCRSFVLNLIVIC